MMRKHERYHIMRKHRDQISSTVIFTNANLNKAQQHCYTLNKITSRHASDTHYYIFDTWTRRPI